VTVVGSLQAAPIRRISRPTLTTRTRDALERGSLLVVADAGFGKTTALEEALEGWRQAAWISCSEADRDPGRLLVNVVAVMRGTVPGAVDVLADRLATRVDGVLDPHLPSSSGR
jgi:ATP/maltotriose-dependent transcriptional regulator MalT